MSGLNRGEQQLETAAGAFGCAHAHR